MIGKPPLVDTNILVYAYDRGEKAKHDKAKQLMLDCWLNNVEYSISTQNLSEFYVIVTKKIQNPMEPQKAGQIISDILDFNGFNVISPTVKTIPKAVNLSIKYGLPYWDAMLAATMIEWEVTALITEDTKHFQRIPHIKTKNPLKQ